MSGGAIDWVSGQKHLVIGPQTWAIKSVAARVESAKQDLRRAGHHADADILTDTKLNTAFYKLPPDVRANYMADRQRNVGHANRGAGVTGVAGNAEPRARAKKAARTERLQGEMRNWRETNFERTAHAYQIADAQSNMAISRSIGLAPRLADATVYGLEGNNALDDDALDGYDRPFRITALVDETEVSGDIYRHPMCGGVLSTAGSFDQAAKNVLIVRVSSAGLESTVGALKKVDAYTVHIPVTRINRLDFVHQLNPPFARPASRP
jgi:hypothetical protein